MRALIFFIVLAVSMNVYAQEEFFKDPFDPAIPVENIDAGGAVASDEIAPPDILVEGILWGTDMPQAIIDGEVYKVGDNIKGPETQLFGVEKNTVLIRHKMKIFEFGVKGQGVEKKEVK